MRLARRMAGVSAGFGMHPGEKRLNRLVQGGGALAKRRVPPTQRPLPLHLPLLPGHFRAAR
jgi:hypothetical protein